MAPALGLQAKSGELPGANTPFPCTQAGGMAAVTAKISTRDRQPKGYGKGLCNWHAVGLRRGSWNKSVTPLASYIRDPKGSPPDRAGTARRSCFTNRTHMYRRCGTEADGTQKSHTADRVLLRRVASDLEHHMLRSEN